MPRSVYAVMIGGETWATFKSEREAILYAHGEWGEGWGTYVDIEKERVYLSYEEWKVNN